MSAYAWLKASPTVENFHGDYPSTHPKGVSTQNLLENVQKKMAKAQPLKKESLKKPGTFKVLALKALYDEKISYLDYYNPQSMKARVLNRLVVRMIIKDIQTICIFEYKGFRDLINSLDPRFQLPSCKLIRNKLLPGKNFSLLTLISFIDLISPMFLFI